MSKVRQSWLVPALLAITLLIGACGASQSGSVTKGDATQGRSLWPNSGCAGCHGVNAQGSTGGPALADTPLTLVETTSIVRRGGPGMPKYSESQISDQDLRDLYAWFQNPVQVVSGELEQDPWTGSPCAGCHGISARGGTGPGLAGTLQPFATFQLVVRQGAEGMPAYGTSQISATDLQRMYDWLEAQAEVPATEESLWVQVGCGGCHGANAGGGSAPALTGQAYAYSEFQRVVREGEEGMPAYSASQISDTDLRRMYDWLMALP